MSVNVTAHVVQATCPFCGERVRSSLELRDALLDLAALIAEARTAFGREREREVYRDGAVAVERRLDELRAELRGQHLRCEPADPNPELIASERLS